MKSVKLAVAVAVVHLICKPYLGAAPPAYEQEILTMFAPGTVGMPPGMTSAAVSKVNFTPPEIQQILLQHTAETISFAFPDADPADTTRQCRLDPTKTVRRFEVELVYKIFLADSAYRNALNDTLMSFDQVFFSQNNGTVELCIIPNDDSIGFQWGLHNTGQSGGIPDVDIDAPEAWDLEQGENIESIVILDSGVKLNHEDLAGKVSGEWLYLNPHGTHVAGIVAAQTNNSLGIAGVSWNARMISKNIENYDHPGLYYVIWDLLGNENIVVMNSSWSLSEGDDILIHSAFAAAVHVGVAMVVARGNADWPDEGDTRPIFPACSGPWITSVGSFTDVGGKADYSHYGNGMDFLAPGGSSDGRPHDIISCWPGQVVRYQWAAGTSMAAPHVTGIVSLIHDYTTFTRAEDYEVLLRESCIDVPPTGYDELTGWGRVNADSALKLVTFPNEVFAYQPAYYADPYLFDETGYYEMRCVGWGGLWSNILYSVKRYEYRADIVFGDDLPKLFAQTPIAWGCAIMTYGLTDENPNYYVPYCGVVDGTLTLDGVTLKTYFYEVWDLDHNEYYGFYPADPNNLIFHYSVVGDASPLPPSGLSVAPSPDYHPYLQWDHNTEADLLGYKIYRMVHGIEEDWVLIGDVPAGTNYFEDTEYSTPHPGPYAYWKDDADYTVTACDNAGGESKMPPFVTILVVVPAYPYPTPSKFGLDENELPHDFSLSFYPNPFNVQAVIEYALPEPSFVEIEIFNLSGQRIKALRQAHSPAGYYEIIWDASNVSSGIYFCRIQAGNYSETKRMTLLK